MWIQNRSKSWLQLIAVLYFSLLPMLAHAQTAVSNTNVATSTNNAKRVPMSHLFISLSDAMDASKKGQPDVAKNHLMLLQSEFAKITEQQSAKGQEAAQAITQALANPTPDQLSALSNALYAFEQEQNPVDYSAKRQAFKKQIQPAYEVLNQAITTATSSDLQGLKHAYQQFNSVWLATERVVRNTSMGHYGKIETAMALMRVT